MSSKFYKPQSPLEQNGLYLYPLTTTDQVIDPDGERLNVKVERLQQTAEQSYSEAIDPAELNRTYTEGDVMELEEPERVETE